MNLSDIIEPWGSRLAVRVETKKEFTPSGLYIPVGVANTIHEQRPTQGEIVALGSTFATDLDLSNEEELFDAELDLPRLKLGDWVLFNKHAGHKISFQPPTPDGGPRPDKEEIIILQEKDILARIKPTDATLTVKS